MIRKYLLLIFLFVTVLTNRTASAQNAKIDWDEWGVPHITANNEKDLFFAQGWAQMQAHANLVLQLYGISRGKAAAYWGARLENSDLLIHNLDFPEIALKQMATQKPELKQIIRSFTDGMNAYAKAHPEAIEKDKQVVLPVTPEDVTLQCLFVFVTRFVAGGEMGKVANWQDVGSNAMAIAAKRSASGKAMLIQNPHLPWQGEYTFFENELILNGNPIYGAQIVGFPGIAIGFNRYLGWTHTNNTLDNADSFVLILKDGGYLLDGKKLNFKTHTDTIRIKQADGSLITKPVKCYESVHGQVLRMGTKKAVALRVAGLESSNALLEWWKMANSTNFSQFESALKMQQIPFWNVLYADVQGNIFYLFNGLVPRRSFGSFEDWNQMISGDSSKNIWKGYLRYDELPKLKNPASGWLQNTNDPPWTATLPRELLKRNYPDYIAPDNMQLRSQQSANMLMADSMITFDKLVDIKLSTHVLLADRVLDDLLSGIDSTSSPILKEAKQVLANWDRHADNDSKGMVLFYAWALNFEPRNDYNYAIRWNTKLPNTTPSGLRDKKHAVQLLEQSAQQIKATYGDLSVPWGTFMRLRRNGKDLPANGADGVVGIFRVASAGQIGKTTAVAAGDSWVGIIEFGNHINAKVLLSYGNSTQKQSPHNGDQLKLFSEKKLRTAWFYPEDLKGHIDFTETQQGETFIKQQ